MNDCVFCKIAGGEIPSNKVYEDDTVVAFHDLAPLRRRLDDIPLLAAAFVEKYSAEMGKQVAGTSAEAATSLTKEILRLLISLTRSSAN